MEENYAGYSPIGLLRLSNTIFIKVKYAKL